MDDPVSEASVDGLTTDQAARRLIEHGPNTLPRERPPRPVRQFLGQMAHFFAIMLWVAAALALGAGMPPLALAIVVVIVLNGTFAFAQEHRAERAAERLRDLLPRRVTVRRDGLPLSIDAAALVPGDLVLLAAGDRVSADLQVVAADGLRIDASTLTGESRPIAVPSGAPVHGGTFVLEGTGEATVVATGERTALAEIARLTRRADRPPSPLTRELRRVVITIARIAIAVGVTSFVVALLVGTPAPDGLLLAVGVVVALVPEGLLPTVTLSLALGAQRMARRGALVRHLDAVETLGATTCICTDKTGTLTANEMVVVQAWSPRGRASVVGAGYSPDAQVTIGAGAAPAITALARAARACSDGRAREVGGRWMAVGDPMEAAIDAFARRVQPGALDPPPVGTTARFPFDPTRKMMSVVTEGRVIVKGAPESVLPRCSTVPTEVAPVIDAMTTIGLRVLAVAVRPWPGDRPRTPGAAERDLELLGLLGLEDPPRPSAAGALRAARTAGMRVVMLTGDHPATALAIAREVGVCGPEGPAALLGAELPADDEVLGALIDRDGTVIARVDPPTKLRVAHALQRRGHVVAMTGDGVNDGPALRAADVGIAMGRSGTDVAREAADLVLLDDEFRTIVAAIEEGRAAFANVRRFLTFHLSANVAELVPFVVWGLSGGRIPLALTVLQIISIDLVADALPALALGSERASPGALRRPVDRRHLLDASLLRRAFLVLGPTEGAVEMLAFLATFAAAGWRPGSPVLMQRCLAAASGAAFSAVVIGQAANAFACRSTTRPAWSMRRSPNPRLRIAVAVALLILVGSLGVPPVARLLRQAPPTPAGLAVAMSAAPAILSIDALTKWFGRRRARRDRTARDPTPRAVPVP